MIAPHNARICHSSRTVEAASGPTLDWCLLPEHPHATAHDEQQAGQDDQDTATAAPHPRSARPLRVEETPPAEVAASARSVTHEWPLSIGGERIRMRQRPDSGAI